MSYRNTPLFLSSEFYFFAGAAILAVSSGASNPYYLYAISPLLAGAFFFQMRDALNVSAFFTPLYLIGNYLNSQSTGIQTDIIVLASQLAGIWLIPILFAYPSILLKDINKAREEVANTRDELPIKKQQNA